METAWIIHASLLVLAGLAPVRPACSARPARRFPSNTLSPKSFYSEPGITAPSIASLADRVRYFRNDPSARAAVRHLAVLQQTPPLLPEILWKKQELLRNFRKKGDFSEKARFQAVRELVRFIYFLDPEDAYTYETDRFHYREVLEGYLEARPGADFPSRIAVLFHDIERYMPSLKTARFTDPSWDETVRKKILHPLNSARIARTLLEGFGYLPRDLDKIDLLIRYHDAGPGGVSLRERVLLPALASSHPWRPDLEALSEADAAAFFKTTIYPFVRDRLAKNHAVESLLMRIHGLYARIRTPALKNHVDALMEQGADADPESLRAQVRRLFHRARELPRVSSRPSAGAADLPGRSS
jgi:hypothetical protein